ncbi:MAG: NmrA family NAD(P)-binding protein [Parafilimonas terrae]|nr:NmrA family NAD(P)-binding protein [Parafilimonas terrae]
MQASIALNLAREAGVAQIVYLSILSADRMVDVPHAACKLPIERMIFDQGLPATVLRASMFMQNDLAIQPALLGGVYPWPIGGKGLAHVDVRDVGEVAAIELLRRETAPGPLPPNAIAVCGPDELTGDAVAAIWTEVLGRDVAYAGDDLDALERGMLAQGMPAWLAYDFRMMFRAMQVHGQAEPGAAGRVGEILGRPPRTYRAFAEEAASRW